MSEDPLPMPIGIFDSGVGGLSVLRALRPQLHNQPILYFADQANVPYGSRSLAEVGAFSIAITQFLLRQGARLVVVACNTASAAALHLLRTTFPEVPFVGMEPAVKPAAELTRSGVVGVLATPATFQGSLYASVVERFAGGVTILKDTCPGLVQAIELGNLNGAETQAILEKALAPMLQKGIDTVVLGCTHYPFVIPLIEKIVGPEVRVIDPAPAVARQVRRLLSKSGWFAPGDAPTPVHFFTSGDPFSFSKILPVLIQETGPIAPVRWGPEHTLDGPPGTILSDHC
jgi:glutamate racemase